ncbi:MAG: AI-2E family transporter [Deltaproteobacteria bacterium]|nr:AI-2E family transporter [Deltaproteobacteria bacterium]
MNLVVVWLKRQLTNPQVVILGGIFLACFLIIYFLGRMLIPLFVALIIAYMLEGVIRTLARSRLPRSVLVAMVFSVFLAMVLVAFFLLIPLLIKQITQLVQQIPNMVDQAQIMLKQLPEKYPRYVSHEQIEALLAHLQTELVVFGQNILAGIFDSVIGFITLVVYVFIVPLLVFFFLKDKDKMIGWITGFLPRERSLSVQVWLDADRQIGNYIRGKAWEILIIWSAAYIIFTVFKLPFAMLLSLLVGLSVIVPYVGATVVTVPVVLVAYFHFGISPSFFYVSGAYLVLQILDGNLLVPLLFAEVVDLHPVATISALFIFGGLWGLWGVFFAIPLATLIQAVLTAWPRSKHPDDHAPVAL